MSRARPGVAVAGALLSVMLWCSPAASWAGETDLEQAAALLHEGKAKEAYALLSPQETENAGNPEFDYLLGLAAIDSGNAVLGIFALERVLAVEPNHAGARVAIARAHYMLGENESARLEFQNILKQNPPEDAIQSINRYMSAIDRALGDATRFNAYLEATWGHDSNINGAPSAQTLVVNFAGLPLPVTLSGATAEKSDNFLSLGAGIGFNYPLSKTLSVFGNASGTERTNWSSNMFETSTVDLNLGLRHKLGPDVITAAVQDGNFYLDDERYRHGYGIAAQWQHDLNDRNQLSLFGQALRLHYPSADIRDADRRLIGAGFGHAFNGDLSPVVFMNAYVGEEDERASDRPDMGHNFHGVRTGGQITLTPKTVLFATANYESRRYGGPKPFFTETQRDHQYEFSIGARYLPIAAWQIKPQLSYVKNDSNIPITDYDRWMLSVTFRHDFEW